MLESLKNFWTKAIGFGVQTGIWWNLVEFVWRAYSYRAKCDSRDGWRKYLQMQVLQLGRSLQSESEDTLESETWSGKRSSNFPIPLVRILSKSRALSKF